MQGKGSLCTPEDDRTGRKRIKIKKTKIHGKAFAFTLVFISLCKIRTEDAKLVDF